MTSYAVLLRGINVGGRNRVPMAGLRACLQELGFEDVVTYIQSGNVVLRSDGDAADVAATIEGALPRAFALDSDIVRALALDRDGYARVVDEAPAGFGEDPDAHRYNVVFLIGIDTAAAIEQFEAREGVDRIWPGPGVVYFANTRAGATKSRLTRITQRPVYRSTTIRNWTTTLRLLALLDEHLG